MRNLTRDDFSATAEHRFWKYVSRGSEHECWLWQGARTPERQNQLAGTSNGYGTLSKGFHKKGNEYAHRAAYVFLVGDIPEGMVVMHSCDTPRCCNPQHLVLGTMAANSRDREFKGRSPRTQPPRLHQYDEIVVCDYNSGTPYKKILADRGISVKTLYNILQRNGVKLRRSR